MDPSVPSARWQQGEHTVVGAGERELTNPAAWQVNVIWAAGLPRSHVTREISWEEEG